MTLKNIGYGVVVAATALMFVLGSAATGEAKGKKKAAAPAPPPPATCWFTAKAPVCAAKGKLKFTYINSCYAAKDGAKSAKQGACKAPKAGKKGGGKKKAKKAKGKKKK
jgi:hypothetical protein